jgi:hypothetical protein
MNFIEKQMEISDKLFKAMAADHNERLGAINTYSATSISLIKKLQERDEEIARLRAEIKILKGIKHGN